MSTSLVILSVIILLIMFGAGQRILDKMRLNDKWALIIMVAIVVGILIPNIHIGKFLIFSIGGFLIPFGVAIYLMVMAGRSWDLFRAIIGSIVTAGIILLLEYVLPADPEEMIVDTTFLYGVAAGLVAYLLGRSRRNALICSVMGILLAKVIQYIINVSTGIREPLTLGVAGALDVMLISVLIAVALAEVIGKSAEAIVGKDTDKEYSLEKGEFVSKGSKNESISTNRTGSTRVVRNRNSKGE